LKALEFSDGRSRITRSVNAEINQSVLLALRIKWWKRWLTLIRKFRINGWKAPEARDRQGARWTPARLQFGPVAPTQGPLARVLSPLLTHRRASWTTNWTPPVIPDSRFVYSPRNLRTFFLSFTGSWPAFWMVATDATFAHVGQRILLLAMVRHGAQFNALAVGTFTRDATRWHFS